MKRQTATTVDASMFEAVKSKILDSCIVCPYCEQETYWNGNNKNVMWKAVVEIDFKRYNVRRAMFQIANPDVKRGKRCVTTKCHDDRCINPELFILMTKGAIQKRAIGQGKLHNIAHKISYINGRRNRADTVLDASKVMEIRASTKTIRELSKEYGVSPQSISNIVRYRTWTDVANPFQGLMR